MTTVFDVRRELFKFFSKNSKFDLLVDFERIFPLTEDKAFEVALIKEAFREFVAKEIVVCLELGEGRIVWVLTKPLLEYAQTIELSYSTISALTDTINGICDQEGFDKGRVDPLNIKEIDIQNAIILINNFQQKGNFNE
jgi:hypothetical protein